MLSVHSFRLPKGCAPGWYFTGHLTLAKDEPGKPKVSSSLSCTVWCLVMFSFSLCWFSHFVLFTWQSGSKFKYFVSELPNKSKVNGKKKEKEVKDSTKDKFTLESMTEAIRDLKISWLAKLVVNSLEKLVVSNMTVLAHFVIFFFHKDSSNNSNVGWNLSQFT